MKEILIFFVAHWYLSLFFQTFFLHRYAAHKAFTMNKFTEKVVYILTWIFQGSNYLSPYGYGVMHRMHHALADTENDPHSPKYDEIQKVLGKKADYCRQLLSRARKKLDESAKVKAVQPESNLFESFKKACDLGNVGDFVQHLKTDIAGLQSKK